MRVLRRALLGAARSWAQPLSTMIGFGVVVELTLVAIALVVIANLVRRWRDQRSA